MQAFRFIVTPPAEPCDNKSLQKSYQKLAADLAAAESKRSSATAEWIDIDKSLDRYAANRGDVASLRKQVNLIELEIAALERELPLAERTINEYLTAALEHRNFLVAVARERVTLAEQHVVASFQREFDPNRWPISQTALAVHVRNHPIVRGAEESIAAVKIDRERSALQENRVALDRMKQRLASLQVTLTRTRKRLSDGEKSEAQNVALAAEEKANAEAFYARDIAPQIAMEKRAAEAARRSVGL